MTSASRLLRLSAACRPSLASLLVPCPAVQAEETAAKLRELEMELMLRRQENRRGWPCCCFMITLASDTLPDHLRVWESRLM